MVLRPTTLFGEPPVLNPLQEYSSHRFYQLTGFWPDQFVEVADNLLLIPDVIVCDRTHCSTSKTLALFVMLRKWQKADTWDDVAHAVHCGHVWCIKIYRKIFSLLSLHYRWLVRVLDYRRILLLLADRSDELVYNTGCTLDDFFSLTGSHGKQLILAEGKLHKLLLLLWVVMT
jgi:hypothetical protein